LNYTLAFVSGATSGLGRQLCTLLARKKTPLFITGRDSFALRELQQTLEASTEVIAYAADLSNKDELQGLIEKISYYTPDLIINSAGLGLYGEILSLPVEKQMEIIQVNIDSLTRICIESARALSLKQKRGTIMNISSVAALFTYPGFAVYAASKKFVEHFSLSFDLEVAPLGIRVLTCLPGRFLSRFAERASGRKSNERDLSVMSLEKTAYLVMKQIEKQKRRDVIDFRYKLLRALSYLLPEKMIAQILKKKNPR